MRLVEEELAINESCFRVLIDRDLHVGEIGQPTPLMPVPSLAAGQGGAARDERVAASAAGAE
jgi:hypothetical protein